MMRAQRPEPGKTYLVENLARFAIEKHDFPNSVLHEAKRIILDQLGCQMACATLPWSLAFRATMSALGEGQGATVVYHGNRMRIDQAVFLNSCFGHGAEYDDTHLGSSTHAGAVIVPVALAVSEKYGSSGHDILGAVIVGLETMIRIAGAAAPYLHERGHHVPPAVGPFGAAACTSRLIGHTAEITAQAMSISGSYSAGLLEFTQTGGTVKRSHCAIGGVAGLRASIFAENGITGPLSILEGKRGFLRTFAGEFDETAALTGLGCDYALKNISYKPITSAFPAHAAIEALGFLQEKQGFSHRDVARIRIGTSKYVIAHVGAITHPDDIAGAHYSLAYGCAVRLIRQGNGFYHYCEDDLRDPLFHELADRVELYVDETAEAERESLNNRGAIVTVSLTDGTSFEKRVTYSRGHVINPLSDAELTQKFLDCASPRIGFDRARRLADLIWDIERLANARALVARTIGSDQHRA